MPQALLESTRQIQSLRSGFRPRIGIVLGSGLGPLADRIDHGQIIPFADLVGFPNPRVAGHSGNLIIGQLSGCQIALLQGRCHLYEGWSVEQTVLPTQLLLELGIELLILTNASGGINTRLSSGQVTVIDAHINALFRAITAPTSIPNPGSTTPNHFLMRTVSSYDRTWIQRAQATAMELGFALPAVTYLATLGPNYETRAEYRAFARMGADVVGMSTVPEAILAMQHGVPVLAFSVVTNVANSDVPNATEHEDVLEWSAQARSQLQPLVENLIAKYVRSQDGWPPT